MDQIVTLVNRIYRGKVCKKSRPKKGDCKHRSLSNLHAFSFARCSSCFDIFAFSGKRRNSDSSFTITVFRPGDAKENSCCHVLNCNILKII